MASLTDFLIELSGSPDVREAFQDERSRDRLLDERGLAGHPALQPGATVEDLQRAVADEQPGAEAGVEWWILADSGPVANDAYESGGGPQGEDI